MRSHVDVSESDCQVSLIVFIHNSATHAVGETNSVREIYKHIQTTINFKSQKNDLTHISDCVD